MSSPTNTPLNTDRKSKLPYSLCIDSFQLLKQFLGLAKSSIFLAPQGNRNIFIHPSEKSFLDIETFYCCNSFSLLFISSPIWINITQENATCKSSFYFYFTFFVRLRNGVDFAISRLLDYFYCFIACEKKENENFFTREVAVEVMLHNFEIMFLYGLENNETFAFLAVLFYETFRNISFVRLLLRKAFEVRVSFECSTFATVT